MDWATAIERHRQPLLGIVAALYAMIGLADGGTLERLSRPLHRAVLSLLRPAESAVRRLIVVAARGLAAKPYVPRAVPAGLAVSAKGQGRQSFQLLDPPPPQDGGAGGPSAQPRIRLLDVDVDPRIALFHPPAPPAPEPEPPAPDDSISAVSLCRRLAAIRRALKDLRRQARRYVRWRAKAIAERRPRLDTMLRRGLAPGLRRKASHEVHAILSECDWLARTALAPDTS